MISFEDAFTPAYLPSNPLEPEFNNFKQVLTAFIEKTNPNEGEEHNKNLIPTFLQAFGYQDKKYQINTAGNIDLAISKDKNIEVIIEVKRPKGNEGQMVTVNDLNKTAFHEALLYYMRQIMPRGNGLSNPYVKHIIITNNIEWYIINASFFNKLAKNKNIKKAYIEIDKNKTASATSTQDFYRTVEQIIDSENLLDKLEFVYINFNEKYSDRQLKDIYKIFTPRHLLNELGANDSNTLNKKFYNELLYILGLEETGKSKKLIQRKLEGSRHNASLIENTILKLETEFSITDECELFEIALELNITWLNRLLFLKLLEAKLVFMNKENKKFDKFLLPNIVQSFDILNTLFFEVLAKKIDDRNSLTIQDFQKIPYLNSSLFETTDLEKKYLRISGLKDNLELEIYPSTKTELKEKINTLEYLLIFLDSYAFGADASDIVKKDTETFINASVLGLIFEKINGYKDGSFFTPSFITMYMTKESIRKTIVSKFNEAFNIQASNFMELKRYCELHSYKDDFLEKANSVINGITIVDPAVGSGHFLVSSLNELISIKSELSILKGLTGYEISNVNDELYIKNCNGLFKYQRLKDGAFLNETQKVQEAIFNEKQRIIETQLFGVDINPNSVKITRLRLWIELLKNSYYENDELITLPNIDINIKCGNSLISKFPLNDSDTKNKLLKDSINEYKSLVKRYVSENNKITKQEIEDKINEVKKGFKEGLHEFSPTMVKFKKTLKEYVNNYKYDQLSEELIVLAVKSNHGLQTELFNDDKDIKQAKIEMKDKLLQKLNKMYQTIKEFEDDEIYEYSFEWRFEFPEVLNGDGDFIGFDIVIGNPPYIGEKGHKEIFRPLQEIFKKQYVVGSDLFYFFFMKSIDLLKENGNLGFITTNYFLTADGAIKLRGELKKRTAIYNLINFNEMKIFESATGQHNIITMFQKTSKVLDTDIVNVIKSKNVTFKNLFLDSENIEIFRKKSNELFDGDKNYIRVSKQGSSFKNLFYKMTDNSKSIGEICSINVGFKTGTDKITKKDITKVYDDVLPNEITLNSGVFMLNEEEYNTIEPEEDLIFKCYKSSDIDKYYSTSWRNLYVIRTNKDTDIEKYPNIKNHLEIYRKILEYKIRERGELSPWYANYRTRDNDVFTNKNKIIFPYRSNKNIFSYSDNEYFASGDILYLRQEDETFDIKYLLALLNSKLYYIWLYYKGKRKGETLELYKTPISQIPIKNISKEEQQSYIKIVDEIITLKKENKDTKVLEGRIDKMVYLLYGLTKEEVNIIEKKLNKFTNQT